MGEKKRKSKTITAWAGISEDKIFESVSRDAYDTPASELAIYTTRKGAKGRFQKVLKVEIKLIGKL